MNFKDLITKVEQRGAVHDIRDDMERGKHTAESNRICILEKSLLKLLDLVEEIINDNDEMKRR